MHAFKITTKRSLIVTVLVIAATLASTTVVAAMFSPKFFGAESSDVAGIPVSRESVTTTMTVTNSKSYTVKQGGFYSAEVRAVDVKEVEPIFNEEGHVTSYRVVLFVRLASAATVEVKLKVKYWDGGVKVIEKTVTQSYSAFVGEKTVIIELGETLDPITILSVEAKATITS